MKTRAIRWVAVFLIGLAMCSPPGYGQDIVNLLENPGFESGTRDSWNIYGSVTVEVVTECEGAAVPEEPIEGDYCLYLDVAEGIANYWDAGLQPTGEELNQGKRYTCSAFMKSKQGELQVNMKIELSVDPWTAYAEGMQTITEEWAEYHVTTDVLTSTVSSPGFSFHVGSAVGGFWVDDVKYYEGQYVETTHGPRVSARKPDPEDGAIDVRPDVVLSWEAGQTAVAHDIYFGAEFDDVNNADRANPLGVLVSQGQTGVTFDPAGVLDFDQTYYWRIDEVNAAPGSEIYKGEVWSFTAESFVYTMQNIIATTNATSEAGKGPDNLINGSGLNTADQHSTETATMWIARPPDGNDLGYVQFEFDRIYKMYEMMIWNYNMEFEWFIGVGVKDVSVEYSVDGQEWMSLTDLVVAQATGTGTYTANTIVPLDGIAAKFVRMTIRSSYGTTGQYGMSEVRFLYTPVYPREPKPADGATGVDPSTLVSWRPGRGTTSHEVYLSTDGQAVAEGTALVATTAGTSYDPQGLDLGSVYFWQVVGINENLGNEAWEGGIWSFVTDEYRDIEGFDSYTDNIEAGETIWQTWIDGLDDPANGGGVVGYGQSPFAEQDIVRSGSQSMPLSYDNTDSPFISEGERTWATPQNWASYNADVLKLYVHGNAATFQEIAPNRIAFCGAGTDIWDVRDEFRFVYKTLSGNGSITARVDSIDNTDVWAKAGVMIRETVNADSVHATTAVTPASGVSFQRRPVTADISYDTTQAGLVAPYWVRITRSGNTFTSQCSEDGVTWVNINSDAAASTETITMGNNVLIGLAVCSHSADNLATGVFADVTTTGSVTGQWTIKDIGIDQVDGENLADTLYVAIEDNAGHRKIIYHPDVTTVLKRDWQEWSIPMSELTSAGVNMNAVKKMAIGLGDPSNPLNGSGLIFVDDIQVGHPVSSVDPGNRGLVAYYPMENDTLDSSGNGPDGTPAGDPIYVNGPAGYGMAMEFDGTGNQRVNLGTFNPSADTGQLSVSLWARWNGLTEFYQGLIGKRDSWAVDDMMWQIEATIDTGALGFSRTEVYPADGDPVLPMGEWTHLAVTFDGTTAAFYVDGVKTGQGDFSFGTDTGAGVVIGDCQSGGGNPFNGALDEVRIYNRALMDLEVSFLAGQ